MINWKLAKSAVRRSRLYPAAPRARRTEEWIKRLETEAEKHGLEVQVDSLTVYLRAKKT